MTMSNTGNQIQLKRYKIQRNKFIAYHFDELNYSYWEGFAEFWGLKIETV